MPSYPAINFWARVLSRRVRRTFARWAPVAASSPPRVAAAPRRVRRVDFPPWVAPQSLRRADSTAYMDCTAHMAPQGGHDADCSAEAAPRDCNDVLFGAHSCLHDGQASSKIFRNAIGNHGARYFLALVRKRFLQCCEGGVGFWAPPRSSKESAVSIGVALTLQVPKSEVFCLFLTSLVRLYVSASVPFALAFVLKLPR